jgi:hypothetical protein
MYLGPFKDNQPDGPGMYTDLGRVIAKGAFSAGQATGSFQLSWPDNSYYEGEIDSETFAPQGQGRLQYANGAVDEGEFHRGQLHGKGVRTHANREVQRGTFVNGLLEGRGAIVYANGAKYDGEVRAGSPEGPGCMEYAEGDVMFTKERFGQANLMGKEK